MIIFKNEGLVPLAAVTTMGVNVKDNPNAIGFFGTGLKYAIAVLLRLECEVVLYRGAKRYVFTAEGQKIRGKSFDIVHMNGEPLGFTTELGKTWEAWQAFRELWCNTKDEGGTIFEDDSVSGVAGHTIIKVEGKAINEAYADRYRTVLVGAVDVELDGLEIQFKRSSSIYYRGIRALDGQSQDMMFTYNLLGEIDLTEDRTIKYGSWARQDIVRAILKSDNRKFLREFITAREGTWEHSVDMDISGVVPSDMLLELLVENRKDLSKAAKGLFNSKRVQQTTEVTERVRVGLTTAQEAVLLKARELCGAAGYSVPVEVVFVDSIPGNREMENRSGRFVYQVRVLEYGAKYLATSLLQETLRLNEGRGSVQHQMACIILDVSTKEHFADEARDDEIPF